MAAKFAAIHVGYGYICKDVSIFVLEIQEDVGFTSHPIKAIANYVAI